MSQPAVSSLEPTRGGKPREQRIVEESQTEVRVGYAWAALGKYTRRLQKAWAAAHPRLPLIFVQANDPTAGLSDGTRAVWSG